MPVIYFILPLIFNYLKGREMRHSSHLLDPSYVRPGLGLDKSWAETNAIQEPNGLGRHCRTPRSA